MLVWLHSVSREYSAVLLRVLILPCSTFQLSMAADFSISCFAIRLDQRRKQQQLTVPYSLEEPFLGWVSSQMQEAISQS